MTRLINKSFKFLNSPFGLAFAGFLFTAVLGGFITFYWHKNEYSFQAKLEYEYSLIRAHSEAWKGLYSKIFDQTSKNIVACRRLISIYKYSIKNNDQIKDIIDNFNLVSNEWFKESVVIRSQLKLISLKKVSPEIESNIINRWEKLIDAYDTLYNEMAELVTQYRPADKSPELTNQFNECQIKTREYEEIVYDFGNYIISLIF